MVKPVQRHDVGEDAGPAVLEAALEFARQGMRVFPLHTPAADGRCSCSKVDCGSSGKHPRTTNGLNSATSDEDQVSDYWALWTDANIGLPTGADNGLLVVDVDGPEGEESLRRLTEKYGPLPATRTANTGRGRHLYFKHPGGKVKSKAPISRDYPHVDSRSDGGYVVAPPSLHHTGVRYAFDPTMPEALSEAPKWLVDFINTGGGASKVHPIMAANDDIVEGGRNARLTSLAGSMRRRGMEAEAIEAALQVHNVQRCNPPLPDDEVRAIARSISSYAPGAPNEVLRTLNDAGNAERFAKQWGDVVRYVPELGWLIWKEPHWQIDGVGAVMEMAKQTAFEIYAEGNNVNDTQLRDLIVRHSKSSQQAPRLNAMLELAKSIPTLVVPITDLDADPWVLGVENGTLDLRQGKLVAAERDDYITKVSPVAFDPEAKCLTFLRFLDDIMGGDQELVDYLQRVLGYMLTGATSEQCLFYLYGTGANGKSTLLSVCKGILGGDLCRQTPVETIMARGAK